MKYKSKKTEVDGIVFDSKKEAKRYQELKKLLESGDIQNLELQKKFVLIPAQRINGKCVERECAYKADFTYKVGDMTVVEDTKGFKTKDYIIKRKLMLKVYGIQIREV